MLQGHSHGFHRRDCDLSTWPFHSHRCDQGYQGTECHPEAALPSTIMSDFENQNGWESDWQEVIGGEIVKPEQGCGVISSGSSLYFSKVRAGDK